MRTGAIILAGGESRRMGRAKATLPFGGVPLVRRILELVEPLVTERIVVTAQDQQLPLLPGDVRLARDMHPGRGPLEGLRAGLRAVESSELLFVSSCDAPLLQPAFVSEMFSRHTATDQIVVPCDNNRCHPLAAVYHRSVLPLIETLLDANKLRVVSLLDRATTRRVDVEELRAADPDLRSLVNMNTPEDYQRALAIVAAEGDLGR